MAVRHPHAECHSHVSKLELSIGERALEISPEEAAELFGILVPEGAARHRAGIRAAGRVGGLRAGSRAARGSRAGDQWCP
jgi:hypothetical protein